MQSEEALAMMLSGNVGTTEPTEPATEEIVTYAFEPQRAKITTDEKGIKRYVVTHSNYQQNVAYTGTNVVLCDNIVDLESKWNFTAFDSRVRQVITIVSGTIEY